MSLPLPSSADTRSGQADYRHGSELCTACGLCCSGTLHRAALLEADEVPAASALGLPVLDCETPMFSLPCPMLKNTTCSIYANRPQACRRYRCKVLRSLEAGATTFDDAVAKVRTAKGFIEQVEALMPPGMTLPEARALSVKPPSSELHSADLPGHAAEMKLKLAATALNFYTDRHFRNAKDGRFLELNPVNGIMKGTAE